MVNVCVALAVGSRTLRTFLDEILFSHRVCSHGVVGK
jgi:hypothetical protein